MPEPTIHILSFDPLRLELPPVAAFSNTARIRLPPVRLKLLDLSLGGLLEGAPAVGAEAPVTDVCIDFDGATLKIGEVVDIIVASVDNFRQVWQAAQGALDRYGPLLR